MRRRFRLIYCSFHVSLNTLRASDSPQSTRLRAALQEEEEPSKREEEESSILSSSILSAYNHSLDQSFSSPSDTTRDTSSSILGKFIRALHFYRHLTLSTQVTHVELSDKRQTKEDYIQRLLLINERSM